MAVLVNDHLPGGRRRGAAPRTPQELQRIEALVRSAVGIDDARGDVVSVVSVPFDGAALVRRTGAAECVGGGAGGPAPRLAVLGLLLAFVLGLKVIRALRPEMAIGELGWPRTAGGGVMALPGGEVEERRTRPRTRRRQLPDPAAAAAEDAARALLKPDESAARSGDRQRRTTTRTWPRAWCALWLKEP